MNKVFSAREIFAGICALLFLAAPARGEDVELYVRAEQFTWEEFANGERLLKEDGPRYGLGMRGVIEDFNTWRLAVRAEGMFGEVDYDGHTFAGDPVMDNTDYIGVRGELYASLFPVATNGVSLHPTFGVGSRYWIRRLAEGNVDKGGYDEAWTVVYGRLGVELVCAVSSKTRLYANINVRPALYNNTYYNIEIEDEETFSLSPGRETTWDLEAGLAHGNCKLSFFYETLDFDRSDVRVIPPFEVFQPESEGRMMGVQFGILW